MLGLLLRYCLIICLCTQVVYAQLPTAPKMGNIGSTVSSAPANDTTKFTNKRRVRKEPTVQASYITLRNQNKQYLDTSLQQLYELPAQNVWSQNLGNYNSTVFLLQLTTPHNARKVLGAQSFQPFTTAKEDIPLFKVSNPLSILKYYVGSQQMQGAGILHTQDLRGRGNFMMAYTKIGTPGHFQGQRTIYDQGSASITWRSKKIANLITTAIVSYSKNAQDENGGILADSLLNEVGYEVRSTLPTRMGEGFNKRSNVKCSYEFLDAAIINRYSLGGKADSSFKQIQAVHSLGIINESYRYTDNEPTAIKYSELGSIIFLAKDTVRTNIKLATWQNEIGLQLPNTKSRNFICTALYGTELQRLSQLDNNATFLNHYIKGSLVRLQSTSPWQLSADAQFYFAGNTVGNFSGKVLLSRSFKKIAAQINVEQHILSAPYFMQRFNSNFYNVANSLSKYSHTIFGGKLLSIDNRYSVALRQHTLINYVYWQDSLKSAQSTVPIAVTEINATAILKYKKFVFNNKLLLQQATANQALNLPQLVFWHSTSYQARILKNKLLTNSGITLMYNIPFNAPGYNPFNSQYFYSNQYKQNNVPNVSLFTSAQVSRFRAYIAVDETLQALGAISNFVRRNYEPNLFTNLITWWPQNNRVLLQNYPAQNLMFRAGFTWTMIN